MSQHDAGSDAQPTEPIIGSAAIIAAGLAAATGAIIRPYFETGMADTIIGATLTSMIITTSSAFYKASLENAAHSLENSSTGSASQPRKRRSVLFAGLVVGVIACIVGIAGISAVEAFVLNKTPSIAEDGGPIVPIQAVPSLSSEGSKDTTTPTATTPHTTASTDHTRPTITISVPTDGSSYKFNASVTANYSCQDEPDGSKVKSCSGPVPNGSTIDTRTLGPHTFMVTAEDNAGNAAIPVSHRYTVTQ